jgi:hypothetical protein
VRSRPFFLSDWRASVTVEERQEVRRKIQAAYANQSRSYDDLVEVRERVVESRSCALVCTRRVDHSRADVRASAL